MEKWRNFFLQKMDAGGNPSTGTVYESVQTWGVWCKDIPFKLFDKVKEPAKRSWYDEHGDDEYIPTEGLYLEAYTMTVEFGCKKMNAINDGGDRIAAVEDVRKKVGDFLDWLRTAGQMNMYSSYTRTGRQYVRLQSVSDDATWKSEDDEEWLIFKVTFKVNDPYTNVTKNGTVEKV